MIFNAKQLAGFQIIHIFSERYFQTDIVPFKQTRQLVFISKMFEKHLWKNDVKMKVIDLYLCLKCHSTIDIF